MAKDKNFRAELGTTRVRSGCVIYFGDDETAWIFLDPDTALLTIHFSDGTETTTAAGGAGLPNPANQDFSTLPVADPHVAGKAFIDNTGHVTVSAG